MAIKRNKYSVAVATKWTNGKFCKYYLSARDEQRGLDIELDYDGWHIEKL